MTVTNYLADMIAEGKKPRGGSPVEGLTSVNSLLKIEAEEFDKAIKLKVWDKVAVVNYRNYFDAKKYALSLKLKNSNEWKILNLLKIQLTHSTQQHVILFQSIKAVMISKLIKSLQFQDQT